MRPNELLSDDALSDETGIPKRTLAQWRYLNRGPAWLRLGRHIRYRREDVDAWIAAQRHEPVDA